MGVPGREDRGGGTVRGVLGPQPLWGVESLWERWEGGDQRKTERPAWEGLELGCVAVWP